MKKFYSLLAALLVATVGMMASADEISFTLKVNEPIGMSYTLNKYAATEETHMLPGQETVLTVEDTNGNGLCSIHLDIRDNEYFFTSITNEDGESVSKVGNTHSWFNAADGGVYFIDVHSIADTRTSSFTFNIDDPSKVTLSLNNLAELTIDSTSQVLKFNPEEENVLSIRTKDNGYLYSVKLDGVPFEGYSYVRAFELTNGCVVDVEANFPDISYNVNLSYGEGAEGFFTGVNINDEPLDDFDGTSFSAQMGSKIQLFGNSDEYVVDGYSVNGSVPSGFWGFHRFYLLEDMDIHIDAHLPKDITFTVNVNNPEYVTVSRKDSDNNEFPIELTAGDNTITMFEKDALVVNAIEGCYIESVEDQNGVSYKDYKWFSCRDGYTYTIVAEEITIDKTAVVYVGAVNHEWPEDVPVNGINHFGAWYDTYLTNTEFPLYLGYNVVPFGSGLNPFRFYWNQFSEEFIPGLYVNEQNVIIGSSLWLEDKDVVKIYFIESPTVCSVSFNVTEGVEASVTRDLIVEVPDYEAGFTAFNGTQIDIEGQGLKVSANGNELQPNEEGKFMVVIDEDTEICIDGEATGVTVAETDCSDAPIFNMQGMKVGTKSTAKTLPAGIYLIDGRKVSLK